MKDKLGKFVTQIRGVSYTPADVRNADDFNAIPILRANNITESGIVYDDLIYIDKKCVKQIQLLCVGDILICASSGSKNLVGKAARITENKVCSFGAFCKVIRSQTVDNDFLHYFFQSPYYRKNVSFASAGTNINNIRGEDIENLEVDFPSLSEQKTSSNKIRKIFNLIAKRKQQLEKMDMLVRAKFYEMFWTFDTPIIKVGNVLKTTSGGTPSKEHSEYYSNGNIPWLTSGEVAQGFIYKTKNRITEQGLANSSAKWMPVNTVVIAMYGATAGQVGLLKIATTANQAVCGILPNNFFNPLYLYYAVLLKKDWMIAQCMGGAQPNISQGIIKQMEIKQPPLSEQNIFAQFVEHAEKIKLKIKLSLEKLELLKQSLLQKYFG